MLVLLDILEKRIYMSTDYITNLRNLIGHEPVILVFAGGILANSKNEILLQKRADFSKWGLPGGALEFGETAPEACKREFLEETGLEVNISKLVGVTTQQIQKYPNGDVAQAVVVEFLVTANSEKFDTSSPETLDLRFFHKEHLPDIINEQHKRCIENYFNNNFPYFD